jgi:Na+/H+ antiporter NhaD/arsenite permease-like protein
LPIAVTIFLLTYVVLAIGRLPSFRVDRTIILLFGMMIVVANLRVSGFFTLVIARVVEHAHRPVVLLAAIVLGRASSPRFS